MLAQGSVFTLIDEPTYVADIDSLIAEWVQQQYGILEQAILSESAVDKRPVVKRIWEALNDPDRSNDSASVDHRVDLIRYLEKLLKKQFSNTADGRHHLERFLEGHDGRRLPVAKAIKRARKAAGLSQQDLADLLGLRDHTLISKYESGKRVPPCKVIDWLEEQEAQSVTRKRPTRVNSRTPSKPVTSIRGNEAPISPDLAKSVTSPEQEECTAADAPTPQSEAPIQQSLFPLTDPEPPTPTSPSEPEPPASPAEEDAHV